TLRAYRPAESGADEPGAWPGRATEVGGAGAAAAGAGAVAGRSSQGSRAGAAADPPGLSDPPTSAPRGPPTPHGAGAPPPGRGPPLRPWTAEPPDLVQDRVEAQARDESHHVVVLPLRLAHAEDRHDVGVVQPRRRPRLAVEPEQVPGIPQAVPRQDLQGHAAAQRLLFGLVHHAHAAPAHLPHDSVVPQPLRRAATPGLVPSPSHAAH